MSLRSHSFLKSYGLDQWSAAPGQGAERQSRGSPSLQYHHHRAEHWIVVDGKVEVTRGHDVFDPKANGPIFIAPKQAHRLANRGLEGLKLIEVQCGDYHREDDIVRLEDNYGRQ